MKVFLSWSGSQSHKVALAFRDWLPSVIQTIEPYVSSEDIDKGARWSSDIAGELEDSSFGILCVTRDNLTAPWLTFEAGALSKTIEKSFVCPFLFDIKRSDVDGPILQFQSTIFERDDLKKLVGTLNKASAKAGLPAARLNKSFDVWYPTLEETLHAIKDVQHVPTKPEDEAELSKDQKILEEILELSRLNQKLLRNPENSLVERVAELVEQIEESAVRSDRGSYLHSHRDTTRIPPEHFEELMHFSFSSRNPYVGIQIGLSTLREPMPWVYDSGVELIKILRSRKSRENKVLAFETFERVLDFSVRHSMPHVKPRDQENLMDLVQILRRAFMRAIRV